MNKDNIIEKYLEDMYETAKESLETEGKKVQREVESFIEAGTLYATLLSATNTFSSTSAFWIYYWEAQQYAKQSLVESLSGNYNIGYHLLQMSLEAMIDGAFWNCFAYKRYRTDLKSSTTPECTWFGEEQSSKLLELLEERSCTPTEKLDRIREVLEQGSPKKKFLARLKNVLKDIPLEEHNVERKSARILNIIRGLFKTDLDLRNKIPDRDKREQLSHWGIFKPLPEGLLIELYGKFSSSILIDPDKVAVAKRINTQHTHGSFESGLVPDQLHTYLKYFHKLIDSYIVITLNILENSINENQKAQQILKSKKKKLAALGLEYAEGKITSILEIDR